MSSNTTVTLDEDVLERVTVESRSQGKTFRATINDLLRNALLKPEYGKRSFLGPATNMGQHPYLDYDDIEGLIEYGEGVMHR